MNSEPLPVFFLPPQVSAEPEDLVGAAVYLASEASAMVTGHILYVDGGTSAPDSRGKWKRGSSDLRLVRVFKRGHRMRL